MEGCTYHAASYTKREEAGEQINAHEVGLPYLEATKHLRTCDFLPQLCPQGCGKKMLGHAMVDHIKVCENYEEICSECELNYKPNGLAEGAKHNCLEDLKARMSKATKEKEHMEV